jgi:cytochrome c556
MYKQIGARARLIGFGLIVLTLAAFVAGQNENTLQAAMQEVKGKEVLKLAAAIKAGNAAAVKAQAAALAKEDLEDVMNVLIPRSKGGVGVGRTPGKIIPDGIELKLQAMGRDVPGAAALAREAEALEEMSFILAAVAEVALAKGKPKDKGDKKDWETFGGEMKEASAALRKAVQGKGGAEVKTVSTRINNNCAACHSTFKTKSS